MEIFRNNKFIVRTFFLFLMFIMFFYGDFTITIMLYTFTAIFLTVRALQISVRLRVRLNLMLMYIMVYVTQVVILATLLFYHGNIIVLYIHRLIAIFMYFIPFWLEAYILNNNIQAFYLPSVEGVKTLSFAMYNSTTQTISDVTGGISEITESFSMSNIKEIVTDIPRHSSIRYINNGSLTSEYFEECMKSIDDENIYIVVSNTGSAASDMIGYFTQKQFNHSSISFDRDLKTIISYNGGEKLYPPGLNQEMLEFFNKKEDASIIVYSLNVTRETKRNMIEMVKQINNEGSAYNLLGLVFKQSYKRNIMFCSQFVYQLLKKNNCAYFKKNKFDVKPTDFVEMDYYRKLTFEYEIKFKDTH